MKRSETGRVFVQSVTRDWDEVKASSTKPGLLLIRDRKGHVYRLNNLDRVQVYNLHICTAASLLTVHVTLCTLHQCYLKDNFRGIPVLKSFICSLKE